MNSIDNFTFESTIGVGGFGEAAIYKKHCSKDERRIVIKTIQKQPRTEGFIEREIHAGKLLKHKNVVEFESDFQDEDKHYLAFELAKGADLFKYFQAPDAVPFDEQVAKKVFRQLATAVSYCHKMNVVHLDIKLDNIVYDSKTNTVKLIDFGLCNFINKRNNGIFAGRVGSEEYWPAELVPENCGSYSGVKVDVWCLGIVLYCLLHAGFPYEYKKRIAAIRQWNLHPSIQFLPSVSESAQDLIKKMLEIDPEKRIGMNQVLKHPWLKKTFLEKIFS